MNTSFMNGLFPALATPFLDNENIDENGVEKLVQTLVQQGADGLYVCGSSGESILLSIQERKTILEIAIAAAKGRVPVIAHIGSQRTSDTIELAKHAQSCGAAAISALPPIYYKYTLSELINYYLEVMNSVSLPFIVYNAPALTGIFFDKSNINEIFIHPNAFGMKFTSYDSYRMQRLMAQYPDKVIINGHDETYLCTLALGVKCAIGSTLNFALSKFKKIKQDFESGNLKAARRGQDEVNQIVDAMIEIGVFRGIKAMLTLLELPAGNCRKPFAPISKQELDKLVPLLKLLA
ncbi:MAG: N-acetylneuraminate lyase [Caldicoprobacterales bacterium]|jgi:N-acetylneuraminate lyase|nr:N-acetylneuraminate lyase [Clostridiales bacterium]